MSQQARSRQTRERIVLAAMDDFEAYGYDETTTTRIALDAGVAVGTLYGYFPNKRAILLEVVDATLAQVGDEIERQLAPENWSGEDPRELVRSLIDTLFHLQLLRPGTQRVVWERFFKDEPFREVIEALHAKTVAAIDRFIEALQFSGVAREMDRETAAWVIHNAVQWNASQVMIKHGDEPERLDRAAREVATLVGRYVFDDESNR